MDKLIDVYDTCINPMTMLFSPIGQFWKHFVDMVQQLNTNYPQRWGFEKRTTEFIANLKAIWLLREFQNFYTCGYGYETYLASFVMISQTVSD